MDANKSNRWDLVVIILTMAGLFVAGISMMNSRFESIEERLLSIEEQLRSERNTSAISKN